MKIVHLCSYIQPKLGYQEYYLAKEHAKMGHDVIVISSDRYYPFPDYNNTVKKILGNRLVGKSDSFLDGFRLIRLGTLFEIRTQIWLKGLEEQIKTIKPDLVICHEMTHYNSIRIAMLKKKMKFRLIYDCHGSFVCDSKNILKNIYYSFFNYKLIKNNADRIIGVTQGCVNYVVKRFKIPKEEIEMIPLGADTDLFYKNDKSGLEVRNEYSIKKDDFVIIYTGKIIQRKGVHLILEAMNKVKTKKAAVLISVGYGDEKYCKAIEELASRYKKRYVSIGGVSNNELSKYYSASDLAVWPMEATIGTIEAMACSLPIICNKALIERYEHGNGFGVNPGEIDELTLRLEFFINNQTAAKKMGELSKKVVTEKLSWKVIAKKFLE